jgi:hypothetical protein
MDNRVKFYSWLIGLLDRKHLTFEEIANEWRDANANQDEDELDKRTFHRYRENIQSQFGITVECNKSDGYRYYLKRDPVENDDVTEWMLSSLRLASLGDMLKFHNKVMLDTPPYNTEYLDDILAAIDKQYLLKFKYVSGFGAESDIVLQPAFVRYYKQRWYVVGTNGVKDVRSKASTMFDKYTKMVEAYHYAEDSVRGNIEDFTSLRSDIGTVYRDYALKLIDIYGDSIKMVSPDLFDFKRIEWLDVDEMLKYVELEYNKLTEKCAALIGEISVSFRTSLQGSLQAYKSLSNGNKSLGLAMAGLTMLEHYMGASERANRLKSDLSVFQMSVKHDATRIKADMGRLLVICKTLNDVVIPKANVFLRYGEKLLASDLKATLEALYADETIRPLEEQRKCLLQQMKALDMEMNDHLQNIDVYTSLINDITATLESKQGSYMEAKAKKPSKPFFLVNWITFGMANKNYYRDFAEWNAVCFPLVREYESYQVDLKLDKEELESHREEQTRIKNEYAKLSSELDKVSKEIRSKIVCSDELKLKMLKHLRDMVAMLKLGREIMESKIDEKLVHTVDIPNIKDKTQLPADVEQNLSQFTDFLADNLHANKEMARNLLDGVSEYTKNQKKIEGNAAQQKPAEYSEEELMQVTGAMEQSLQKGIALFDSFAKLKAQQLSGSLASAAYDKELKKHADEFKREMAKIDNKSAYLREVFKRINLAGSEEERKQAMELMSDLSGFSLSEQEFTEFINGKKQIEL